MNDAKTDRFIEQAERNLARLKVEQVKLGEQITSLTQYIRLARGIVRPAGAPPRQPAGITAKRILEHMATHTGPFSSRQMARQLSMPPGSVSGVLTKLGHSGVVENDGAGKWVLSAKAMKAHIDRATRQPGDLL